MYAELGWKRPTVTFISYAKCDEGDFQKYRIKSLYDNKTDLLVALIWVLIYQRKEEW